MDITEKIKRKQDLQYGAAKLESIILESDPLKRTYAELRLPIYIREPGCWLSAPFGEGKSVAMEYCLRSLAAEIPGLPVFAVNEHVLPGNELRSFLRSALIASEYDKPDATRSDILRNRLAQYWAELSTLSPIGCVVLLLDEGNSIRETDESLLKDIGNEIRVHQGALQTLVFGESPKLDNLVSRRRVTARNGAADRLWGGHQIQLHHYENEDDWRSLFKEMDSKRFASLDNLTIRDYFFGHMNLNNYSLEQEATRFWEALDSMKRPKVANLNLRRVFTGIRRAILIAALDTVEKNVPEFGGISKASWNDALKYGCLSDV